MYYDFKFLSKANYDNNKFIHALTYTYNEVMRLLKLINVVEHKYIKYYI
jgi:hypothetical protein